MPTRGDIIVADSVPAWAKLALGSVGKILRSNGTDLVYSPYALSLGADSAINQDVSNNVSPTFVGLTLSGVVSGLTNIYTVTFTDYTASSTITGWQATPSPKMVYYKQIGKLVYWFVYITGTSNSATTTITLPILSKNVSNLYWRSMIHATEGATQYVGMAQMAPNSYTLTFYRDVAGTAFANSGAKAITGAYGFYEAN